MKIDENGIVTLERRTPEQVKEHSLKQLTNALISAGMASCSKAEVQALVDYIFNSLFPLIESK